VTVPEVSGPLTKAVLRLAERAMLSANASLSDAGRQARERLRRPLSLAAVGRLSAGKSTLINALLDTAISPTAPGECTRVVYVFRYAPWTTAQLQLRDRAAPRVVLLDGARLPPAFPVPTSAIRSVDVTLTASLLERMTLIDTPGLESTDAANSAVTERLLADSRESAAEADALLFCLNGPLKNAEAEAVRQFQRGRGAMRLTAGTAVAILTKADQFSGDRNTTWKAATEQAQKMSVEHVDLFSSVLPVVGLLAETATTGALREPHARSLAALAGAWTADDTEDALIDAREFLEADGPVDTAGRGPLLDLLGLFGIGELLEAIRGGTPPDAASLTRVARRASGFDEMAARFDKAVGSRADVLKAAAALELLTDQALLVGNRDLFNDARDMLDLPGMFPLQVMEMARQMAGGRVRPPAGLIEQVWMTIQTGLPPATRAEATRAVRAWREWALLADGEGRRLARVMTRAWQLAVADGAGRG
jgi:hypothetical protein